MLNLYDRGWGGGNKRKRHEAELQCKVVYNSLIHYFAQNVIEMRHLTKLFSPGSIALSRTVTLYFANESSDKFGPVEMFVPYDLRNNLIYCSTLFIHFEILMPIETAILKNALFEQI